jgi:uncharacterized membrane protein YvlD (DUF360 family)
MLQLLITWVALTVGIFAASKILKGFQLKGALGDHFVVSAIFGALLVLVGWLFSFAPVPHSLAVGGLVPFVVRWLVMTILLVATDRFTRRLKIRSIGTACIAALIVAVVGAVTEQLLARLL